MISQHFQPILDLIRKRDSREKFTISLEAFLESRKSPVTGDKLRYGCLSWTYPDWLGSFYPAGSKSTEYLQMYSKVFDLVEIDSSFYRTPTVQTIRQWKEKTPPNFLFTAKLSQKITHELRLSGVEGPLERFEKTLIELGEKLSCIIAQLPPNSKFENEIGKLEKFLGMINPGIRYAIEFRNKSWLREETYQLLSKHNACFVWNVQEKIGEDLAPRLTTDFIYLRFMGKYGQFKKFNKVQIDRSGILGVWSKRLLEKLDSVNLALALVSNHFSGFAPETVNDLKRLTGRGPADWSILASPE
jgi:uncharacterized protein YecE (DUF72 family)